MTTNFLHLISSTPCSMSVNGKYLGTIDNTYDFEIDLMTSTNKLFLEYNPISEKNEYLPYTAMLQFGNKVSTFNHNVKIIPFPNNHYDILFTPYSYKSDNTNELIYSKSIGKFYITINNSNQSLLNIFSNSSLLLNNSIIKINSASADLKKDLLKIVGIISNDEYYILIFDTTKCEIIYEDIVHSINENVQSLETLKNLKDISHHALVCSVDIENKICNKYYVYENNICNYPNNFETIPLDFLQCVRIGDDNKIKGYLAPNLVNTDVHKFQNYFGEFDDIYFNRHEYSQLKLNYTIMGDNVKNYNFVMDGNKIKDIEEVF